MRKLICKWLNLVPIEKHRELFEAYLVQLQDTRATIERFEMQNQWNQVKQERKLRRVH